MEQSSASNRLNKIPSHLRIKILYSDEDIVVIRKPSLLRSVRGIAKNHDDSSTGDTIPPALLIKEKNALQVKNDNTTASGNKAPPVSIERNNPISSIQDAWIAAIKFYGNVEKSRLALNLLLGESSNSHYSSLEPDYFQTIKENALDVLTKLASKSDKTLASISRRGTAFKKYIRRNEQSLLPNISISTGARKAKRGEKRKRDANSINNEVIPEEYTTKIDDISDVLFKVLSTKMTEIYSQTNAHITTKDEDSAQGQLDLLSRVNDDESINQLYGRLIPPFQNNPIYVVHRLDCETSGTMVFARTVNAASFLSKVWRDRDKVTKIYVARVMQWPPLEEEEKMSGCIDLAMGPVNDERLKWEIKDEDKGGKPALTKWKLRQRSQEPGSYVTLELKPITGRTHQLRVHCAAVGSGIMGDSLYGENNTRIVGGEATKFQTATALQNLRLHAEKLSFPHPSSNVMMTFECDHCWDDGC